MIRTPASPARLDAGLLASWFGLRLAAFAVGLAALVLFAFGMVQAEVPTGVSPVRPVLTAMSAGSPAKAPVMLKLDRDVTAMAADIELLADPAMPGPASVTVPPRICGAASFRDTVASPPPSAPVGSLLRPPRTA